MQIYADVTGREIRVAASPQTPALGSAMFGAVAAGRRRGGHDTIVEAAAAMAHQRDEAFVPIAAASAGYDELYTEYRRLHDCFGRGENDVMKTLRNLRASALGGAARSAQLGAPE